MANNDNHCRRAERSQKLALKRAEISSWIKHNPKSSAIDIVPRNTHILKTQPHQSTETRTTNTSALSVNSLSVSLCTYSSGSNLISETESSVTLRSGNEMNVTTASSTPYRHSWSYSPLEYSDPTSFSLLNHSFNVMDSKSSLNNTPTISSDSTNVKNISYVNSSFTSTAFLTLKCDNDTQSDLYRSTHNKMRRGSHNTLSTLTSNITITEDNSVLSPHSCNIHLSHSKSDSCLNTLTTHSVYNCQSNLTVDYPKDTVDMTLEPCVPDLDMQTMTASTGVILHDFSPGESSTEQITFPYDTHLVSVDKGINHRKLPRVEKSMSPLTQDHLLLQHTLPNASPDNNHLSLSPHSSSGSRKSSIADSAVDLRMGDDEGAELSDRSISPCHNSQWVRASNINLPIRSISQTFRNKSSQALTNIQYPPTICRLRSSKRRDSSSQYSIDSTSLSPLDGDSDLPNPSCVVIISDHSCPLSLEVDSLIDTNITTSTNSMTQSLMSRSIETLMSPMNITEPCDWRTSSLSLDSDLTLRKVASTSSTSQASDSSLSFDDDGDSDVNGIVKSIQRVGTARRTKPWKKIRNMIMWSPFIQQFKKQRYPWVQLAGHQGSFLAGEQGTILKKLNAREHRCLCVLMNDVLRPYVPQYQGDVERDGTKFVLLQDLLCSFETPCVMDVKMGVRTYLEEELHKARENPKMRKDMYEKMIDVDPNAPTTEEHSTGGVTKPRYMQWRETISSSAGLGFRIEGIKMANGTSSKDFKKTQNPDQIAEVLHQFTNGDISIINKYIRRLKAIRATQESSTFISTHELIGSSLLFLHDQSGKAGIWMIDFGKTTPLPSGVAVDHRSEWVEGNHEDGYLFGVDGLISLFESLISTSL